jgi:hypothetical protein
MCKNCLEEIASPCFYHLAFNCVLRNAVFQFNDEALAPP